MNRRKRGFPLPPTFNENHTLAHVVHPFILRWVIAFWFVGRMLGEVRVEIHLNPKSVSISAYARVFLLYPIRIWRKKNA